MGLRRTHCHENEVESAVYDRAGVGRSSGRRLAKNVVSAFPALRGGSPRPMNCSEPFAKSLGGGWRPISHLQHLYHSSGKSLLLWSIHLSFVKRRRGR